MSRLLQTPFFDSEGNCNGCGILVLHRLILTVTWTCLANVALIMPLFRQTTITYYIHSTIMWVLVICTTVGIVAEITIWDGRLGPAS